ncbi:MAG: prepilin-type N-terminal cleavage/methylation domain-containing protein [Chthoniobacterales bacterium]
MRDGRFNSGFTLIELLVVISVVAILMALLFPAFQGVQDQAKRTQAKNDLTQIVTAVNAYYTEYGKYPLPNSTGTFTADTVFGDNNNAGSNKSYQLFDTLRAVQTDTEAVALNPRLISFMQGNSVRNQANPRSGFDAAGNFFDPWGRTYAVAEDLSYDNVTRPFIPQYSDLTYSTEPSSGYPGVRGNVIAYSFGKDGKQGTKGDDKYQGSDDVISWQ